MHIPRYPLDRTSDVGSEPAEAAARDGAAARDEGIRVARFLCFCQLSRSLA